MPRNPRSAVELTELHRPLHAEHGLPPILSRMKEQAVANQYALR
jgi:hypothetical protein